MVRGQRGLAKALGVGLKTANKYVNDERWRLGNGPWDEDQIEAAREWRQKYYPTEGEEAAETEKALVSDDPWELVKLVKRPTERIKLLKLISGMEAERAERKLKQGELLKREEVEQQWAARVEAVTREMKLAGRRIALKLVGVTDAGRIEAVVEEEMRSVARRFERGE